MGTKYFRKESRFLPTDDFFLAVNAVEIFCDGVYEFPIFREQFFGELERTIFSES